MCEARAPSDPETQQAPSRGVHCALAVLFAINALNFYDRQVLGAVGEEVRREWALSDSSLGLLGTAFTLVYAVVGLPLGRWTDRGRRTLLLAGGVAVWSILTAVSGACSNFAQLFAARLGVGIGEAVCAPAATSLIADWYPSHSRGRAMSAFMLGLPVGIASSFFASGFIVQHFDWRVAFYVAAAPGIVCALALLWMREPRRRAPSASPGDTTREVPAVSCLFKIPTLWWIVLSGVLFVFCMNVIGVFLVAYLRRFHGLSPWEANLASTVGFGLSGIPGLVAGGWLVDWAARRRRQWRLWLGTLVLLLAAPPWWLAIAQPTGSVIVFTLWVSLGCGLMYFYYSAVYPTLQDVVPAQLRGTAMAIYFCAMYLLGASLGPWLIGLLSDRLTINAAQSAGVTNVSTEALEPFRAEGLRSAMGAIPALLMGVAIVIWAASLTVARDVQRASAEQTG